jgi:hypothetical protein
VWAIAHDQSNPSQKFVIYQDPKAKPLPVLGFWVMHTEEELVGRYFRKSQSIQWDCDALSMVQEGDPSAWGRPIEMWSTKFEYLSEKQ